MRPYYYNEEIIDLDKPREVERALIDGDDLLIHNGMYYLRMDSMRELCRYLIHCDWITPVPEIELPNTCMYLRGRIR